jgi:hypothetical protein
MGCSVRRCGGTCRSDPRTGLSEIRLSEPLLKVPQGRLRSGWRARDERVQRCGASQQQPRRCPCTSQLRPVADMKNVLLHEMIHAYNFTRRVRDPDPGGHGPPFQQVCAAPALRSTWSSCR